MMKPKQKKRGLLLILAAAAIILSACGGAAVAEPTTDPNMVFTQVAETVMVSMTQTSQAMPPTATPEPTATLAPTQPPVPTVDMTQAAQQTAAVPTVALGPTATVQIYGDGAQWKNQSPMDGKVFSEGEEFTFHVCWVNIGSTDWDETFYLQFVDGNNLWSNTKTFKVGDVVEPGDTWCFDLPSVAPWSAGSYITRWYFYDGDGNFINEVYFSYKVE